MGRGVWRWVVGRGVGFRTWGVGCGVGLWGGVWGVGFRTWGRGVWGDGFRTWGVGCGVGLWGEVWGLGFRTWGVGCGVGLWGEVWGLGLGAWGVGLGTQRDGGEIWRDLTARPKATHLSLVRLQISGVYSRTSRFWLTRTSRAQRRDMLPPHELASSGLAVSMSYKG